MPQREIDPSQELQRPTGIKVLSYSALGLGLYHLLKFSQVILNWSTLGKLSLSVPPFYLALNGLVWSISGLILAGGLWTGKRWSRRGAIILGTLYSLVFWIDKIWIAEPESLAQRWLFNLFLTIIGLGMVIFILSLKSSRGFLIKNPAKIP